MTAQLKYVLDFEEVSPHLESRQGTSATHFSSDERIEAAAEVLACMRVLAKSGSNLVAEALGAHGFIDWDHYPPNDVRDPESLAHYYFHSHPASDKRDSDYGHVSEAALLSPRRN